MRLEDAELSQYEEQGYLFIEGLLSPQEMAVVHGEFEGLLSLERQEVVLEKDGKTVRSVLNLHLFNPTIDRLVRHPRLIEPAMQLVDSEVYIFQSIVNFKRSFTGDVWQWHQDFPTYHADDGMLEPRVVNVLVFLEEINEFNGPLMLIPGSHKEYFIVPEVDATTTSYPIRRLDYPEIGELANR